MFPFPVYQAFGRYATEQAIRLQAEITYSTVNGCIQEWVAPFRGCTPSPWVEVGKLEFSASITYDNKSMYVWLRQKGVILTLAGRDSPLKKPESSQRTQQPALGDRS